MLPLICGSQSLQIKLCMCRCHEIKAKLLREKGTNVQKEGEMVGEEEMFKVHC